MALSDFISSVGSAASAAAGAISPISAIVSGISSLFGGKSNSSSLKEQKALAAYNASLEQKYWLERFNLQNEYNSPAAMRDRLRAAGMNENLAYGALSPNTAANPQGVRVNGELSKYQTAMEKSLMQAQLSDVNANIQVKHSEASRNAAQADEARASAENLRSQKGLTDANTEWKKLDNELFSNAINSVGYNPYELDYYEHEQLRAERSARFNMEETYKKLYYELDLSKWNEEKFQIQKNIEIALARLRMDYALTSAQVKYFSDLSFKLQQEGALIGETKDGVILDNGMKAFNFDMKEYTYFLDVFDKYSRGKVNFEKASNLIRQRISMNVDDADKLLNRVQSIVKQYRSRGFSK